MKENRDILVVHPRYGTFEARNVQTKMDAAIRAAKAWGLQWSVVARECDFKESVTFGRCEHGGEDIPL